jgi:Cytochrome c7 and related cytochrome c
MPQIFHPSMNTLSRATIFGAVFIVALGTWVVAAIIRSPYGTSEGLILSQPVPFSHLHHVSECGIDCRYCHTGVESSPYAGIPPTQTCMNCHSQLWAESPMLAPVRDSLRDNKPLTWNRVYDLPDYVYFNHSIHINKGVACRTCHGDVGQMPLTWQASTLYMEWCLACHRNPEKSVGPRGEVFAMDVAARAIKDSDVDWIREYHVQSKTNCSICHR